MKKIIAVAMMLLLALSLVLANVPASANQVSTPLTAHEMSAVVGGGICACGCANLLIFTICLCINDPTGWICE